MAIWKASMPRGNPPTGSVQIVVAVKSSTGSRAEFVCEVSDMKARLIVKLMGMTDTQILKELEGV